MMLEALVLLSFILALPVCIFTGWSLLYALAAAVESGAGNKRKENT